jgi:hypothetical protein
MKRSSKIRGLLFVACLLVSGNMLNAQIDELGKFIAGGKADGTKLFEAYLKPWTTGFGHDLNAGWYHTAKPHKLWGFDINFSASAAFVPTADKSYDASSLGLSGTLSAGPNGMKASSIAGKDVVGPTLTYNLGGASASYELPKGTNISVVPSPMFQVGIGLIKHTELALRFIPNVPLGSAGNLNMWGVAVKHDVMQWLPIVDRVPFLHISVMGGYTRLNTEIDMSVEPEDIGLTYAYTPSTYDNQSLKLAVQSFTFNALASIDIPVLTVFVGAGISNTKTNLDLLGNYPTPTAGNIQAFTSDPLSIVIKGKDGKTTKPRLSAGLKIKMGPVHLFGEYTYANYSLATAGLAVSIR